MIVSVVNIVRDYRNLSGVWCMRSCLGPSEMARISGNGSGLEVLCGNWLESAQIVLAATSPDKRKPQLVGDIGGGRRNTSTGTACAVASLRWHFSSTQYKVLTTTLSLIGRNWRMETYYSPKGTPVGVAGVCLICMEVRRRAPKVVMYAKN